MTRVRLSSFYCVFIREILMKNIITIILIFISNLVRSQDTLQFKVTTHIELDSQRTNSQTIVHLGQLDFDFYKNHFYVPYYYPDQLTNIRYTNDTLTVWNNSTKINDFSSNWSYTIIYDSLSRVTSYLYSNCVICSQLPYDYHFYYNQLGQIIKMTNNLNDDEIIEFKYDVKGNIINIKVYQYAKLEKEIELINE